LPADPGGEQAGAPIGTEPWAQRWRIEVQFIHQNMREQPERLARYMAVGHKHDIWSLLNKRDGTYQHAYAEFCATEEPYGLGSSAAEIQKWIDVVTPGLNQVSIDDETMTTLEALATAEGTTPGEVVRRLVREAAAGR